MAKEKCDYPGCGRMIDPKGMTRHRESHRPGGAPYLMKGRLQQQKGRPKRSYTTVKATGISPRKPIMEQADAYAHATTLVKAESALFSDDATMAVADAYFSEDPYLWNAFLQEVSAVRSGDRTRKIECLASAIKILERKVKSLQSTGE